MVEFGYWFFNCSNFVNGNGIKVIVFIVDEFMIDFWMVFVYEGVW